MDDLTEPIAFRDVRCKDCLREKTLDNHRPERSYDTDAALRFEYSESWAGRLLDRGGSRSDRCLYHRQLHRQAVQGLAVPYIDVQTIGAVANPDNPRGPLGGLGEMPDRHSPKQVAVDLRPRKFGMSDKDVLDILRLLREKQILILKAGTGTGKSTFAPFRLMNPPAGKDVLRLTDFGPIIVTEPKVQATTGVATFVGEKLVAGCPWKICDQHGRFVYKPQECSHRGPITDQCIIRDSIDAPWQVCERHGRYIPEHLIVHHPGAIGPDCKLTDCTDHIGPGYPVGYQVKGDKRHDDSCQLIYVTDGTMVSWLSQGRLSKIGTIIIDEAHERNTGIDFILGFLKREIGRYPHLRVIVTSATFEVDFFVDFFGGPDKVMTKTVDSVKLFGYGAPLFPKEDNGLPCHCDPSSTKYHGEAADIATWRETHWPEQYGPEIDGRPPEDLWDTTEKLNTLRSRAIVLRKPQDWRGKMPDLLAEQVIRLINGLDSLEIHGDILAFLPTEEKINNAVSAVRAEVGAEAADVFALLASTPVADKEAALAVRPFGARRRVLVASNIAETSLTIEGIRFVVDSGLITQSTWQPSSASGSVPTGPHSQAGIRQRWGRVGRDEPGWVFPLYTASQFRKLAKETQPGSTRCNLEPLLAMAKAGGIDDVRNFPWPAAHPYDQSKLDASAVDAMRVFALERDRAEGALAQNGIVDGEGHLTPFGKDLQRFTNDGTAAFAMAVMYADQLACVPEVVTALRLLENATLAGKSTAKSPRLLRHDPDWPAEWRVQASSRHKALYEGCKDDLDFVMRIAMGWEQADQDCPPWEPSEARRAWADRWWIDDDALRRVGIIRQTTLEALSPAMKEQVKRFLDGRLVPKTRAVLSYVLASMQYVRQDGSEYKYDHAYDSGSPLGIISAPFSDKTPERIIALHRYAKVEMEIVELSNFIAVEPWTTFTRGSNQPLDAIDLVLACAEECGPRQLGPGDTDPLIPYLHSWPVGQRLRCLIGGSGQDVRITGIVDIIPSFAYPGMADLEPLEPGGESDTAAAEDFPVGLTETDAAPVDSEGTERWLGSKNPIEDEELLARAVLDPADDEGDRERGLESNDYDDIAALLPPGTVRDVLAEWEHQATIDDVLRPRVIISNEQPNPHKVPDDWFEVTGYEIDPKTGSVAVRLSPSWMPAALRGDPAGHLDLELGKPVEVEIGQPSGGAFRAFWRLDGNGRFLLERGKTGKRRGEHDVPTSLDDAACDVLSDLYVGGVLSVEVVPGVRNTRSISLVSLLADHLDQLPTTNEPEPRNDGTAGVKKRYWPAMIRVSPLVDGATKPEGSAGRSGTWGKVILLGFESGLGIFHEFTLSDRTPGVGDIDTAEGSPVLVSIGVGRTADRPALTHRGLEARLEAVALLPNAKVAFESVKDSQGNETDRRRLISTGFIGPGIRDELLKIDKDPKWQQDVWTFYQRSGERRVRSVLPGTSTTPMTFPLVRRATSAAYAQLYEGQIVYGTIKEVKDSKLWVQLPEGVTGHTNVDRLPAGSCLAIGAPVTARAHLVDPDQRYLVLNLASPFQLTGEVPAHWEHMLLGDHPFSRQRRVLSAACAGQVWTSPPNHLTLGWSTREIAEVGLDELRALLAYPAALVQVPPGGVPRVIGPQHANVNRLGELEGVFSCVLVPATNAFAIVARDSTIIRAVINSIQTLLGAQMIVPSANLNGALIGKGRVIIEDIQQRSGCKARYARGESVWSVYGPSLGALKEFLRLANERVPGCTFGGFLEAVQVTDYISGNRIADWEVHEFELAPLDIYWQQMVLDDGPEPASKPSRHIFTGARLSDAVPDRPHQIDQSMQTEVDGGVNDGESVIYDHGAIRGMELYREEDYFGAAHFLEEHYYLTGDASYRAIVADCHRHLGEDYSLRRLARETLEGGDLAVALRVLVIWAWRCTDHGTESETSLARRVAGYIEARFDELPEPDIWLRDSLTALYGCWALPDK